MLIKLPSSLLIQRLATFKLLGACHGLSQGINTMSQHSYSTKAKTAKTAQRASKKGEKDDGPKGRGAMIHTVMNEVIPNKPTQSIASIVLGTGQIEIPVLKIEYLDEELKERNSNPPPENRTITLEKRNYRHGVDRRVGLFGMKLGMITYFDSWGTAHCCTVLKVMDNQVFETHSTVTNAVRTAVVAVKKSPYDLPRRTVMKFVKYGMFPRRCQVGFPVRREAVLPVGTPLYACHFVPGQTVIVKGKTKNKGFQGVMKKWGFKGGPASHGCTKFHRKGGAISAKGMQNVWRGKKMPGHMGGHSRTCYAKILRIDNANGMIFLRGPVPGPRGTMLVIKDCYRDSFIAENENLIPYPTYVPGVDPPVPAFADIEVEKDDPLVIPEGMNQF